MKPIVEKIVFFSFWIGLIALCLWVYKPALSGDFILDAHYIVDQNPLVKQTLSLKEIFTHDFFSAYKSSFYRPLQYYRPLVTLSLGLNYHWLGPQPIWFRLVNIYIHLLNTFLIFVLFQLLFKEKSLSLLSAFFFCLLPIHEWVVNYVVGRTDLLQAFFSLISLVGLVLYLQKKKIVFYFVSLIAFICALLSREAAIMLPAFILLGSLFASDSKKQIFSVFCSFCVVSIIYYFIRLITFPVVSNESLVQFSMQSVMSTSLLVLDYLLRFIYPWTVSYRWPAEVKLIIYVVSYFSLILFCYRMVRSNIETVNKRVIGFSFFWLLISVMPFFITRDMFHKLGPSLSEHFLYWSAIGFSLFLSVFVLRLPRILRMSSFVLIVYYFCWTGFSNNQNWTSEEYLLSQVVAKGEHSQTVAQQQLLMKYKENLKAVEVMIGYSKERYEKSLWFRRKGFILRQQGNSVEATKAFRQAIAVNEENLDARNSLAISLLEQGRIKEGEGWLRATLKKDSQNFDAYRILGMSSFFRKNYSRSLKYFNDRE